MSPLFRIVIAAIVLFILAPILVVIVSSFNGRELPEFPPSEWSLRWYSYALSQSLFLTSAWNSLWLAAVATALATPPAIAAALAIVRYRFPGRDLIQTILLAPLFVPSIIISLSILVTLAGTGLRNVGMRLVIAHVLIVFPYIVRTVIASLAQLNPQIEEAARTLGAAPARTFWHVTLPLIRPGIIAGVIFAFIVSFDNVSVSLFLTTARTNTLPLAIMNYLEYNFDPSIAAISTILVLMSISAALLLERLLGLRTVVGR